MVSHASSNIEEEDLALALRLSQLSLDTFDEQVTQLRSASHLPCPTTPRGDGKDNLALASDMSQRSPNASEEQVTQPCPSGSAPTGNEASQTTPPIEYDEDNVELLLMLSQLPADIFDDRVGELNQRKESRAAVEDSLAPLLTAMSPVEYRCHRLYT